MLKVFTFFTVLVLLYISGCSADEDEVEVIENTPVNFVSVVPPTGAVISAVATITLTFDGIPTDITTSLGNFEVKGNTVTISDFFLSPGKFELTVTWAGGTKTLCYIITALGAHETPDAGCQ